MTVEALSVPPTIADLLAFDIASAPVLPILAVVFAATYTVGVARLRRERRSWSTLRMLCFLVGCVVLFAVTATGIETYGRSMLSVFIFQQLTLMMLVPPLLVIGSPGRLLLRAASHRGLGRLILILAFAGLRSKLARVLLHPGLVIPLLLFSLFGLYVGGLADLLLRLPAGHLFLQLIFIGIGMLLAIPLLSAGPLPAKTSFPARLFDALAEMQIHAAFGLVFTLSSSPMVPFFAERTTALGLEAVTDQAIAGMLAWTYGEVPVIIILLITLVRWQRQDTRRALRAQKQADRDGDPDLDRYNDYLKSL